MFIDIIIWANVNKSKDKDRFIMIDKWMMTIMNDEWWRIYQLLTSYRSVPPILRQVCSHLVDKTQIDSFTIQGLIINPVKYLR